MKRWLPVLLVMVPVGFSALADYTIDRYQVIIDRKPFGTITAPDIRDQITPTAESFAKSLRLSMIIEDEERGIRIGFVDERTKKGYTLAPGESQDGIELVEADYDKEEAVLKQGNDVAIIKLASGQAQALSTAAAETRMQEVRQGGRLSYAERRRQRVLEQQQQAAQPPPESKFKTSEELEKHLQNYQLEVIRNGMPPLPIPLTKEMDDQLVSEGVLPPQ